MDAKYSHSEPRNVNIHDYRLTILALYVNDVLD